MVHCSRKSSSSSEHKIIRVVGLLAIVKDDKGKIASVQLTQLSDDDRIKLAAGIGALIGFGAAGEEGAKSLIKCCCRGGLL